MQEMITKTEKALTLKLPRSRLTEITNTKREKRNFGIEFQGEKIKGTEELSKKKKKMFGRGK